MKAVDQPEAIDSVSEYTVEPPITDPPRSGQHSYSGQTLWHGLKVVLD